MLTRMFYVNPETEGAQLAGRPLTVVATAGNRPDAYTASGVNLFPLPELLRPLHATAHRCGLRWQEPMLVFAAKAAPETVLSEAAATYVDRLRALARA